LFFATGIMSANPSAAIILIRKVFSIDDTDLAPAKTVRIDNPYSVTPALLPDDVVLLIRTAESFMGELPGAINRLTPVKKEKYRQKCTNGI
jgi:hypothetical protein